MRKLNLEEVKDSLSDDDQSKIQKAIADVEAAAKDTDVEAINKSITELLTASQSLQEAKSKKQAETTTESKKDDSVVDAEYTEKE